MNRYQKGKTRKVKTRKVKTPRACAYSAFMLLQNNCQTDMMLSLSDSGKIKGHDYKLQMSKLRNIFSVKELWIFGIDY